MLGPAENDPETRYIGGLYCVESKKTNAWSARDHAAAKTAFLKGSKPAFGDQLDKNAPSTYPWWTEVAVDPKPQAIHESRSKL
jgi:hypothetical protein